MHLTIKEGLNELKDDKGKLFYGYVPKTVVDNPAGAGILVSIHGYGGRKKDSSCLKRVRKCAEIWSDFANNWRRIILTPHFDLKSFNNRYQQLNLFGRRTDIYLNELIEKMGMLLPGIKNDKIMLFGFSGGGQFVHRYVAFHPERVESAVAAAAGWYMLPDSNLPYPIGTAQASFPEGVEPDLRRLCESMLCIVVGEKDLEQMAYRHFYRGYDLTALQGKGRKNRAENWYHQMMDFADHNNYKFNLKFEIIPQTGHRANEKIIKFAQNYLVSNSR